MGRTARPCFAGRAISPAGCRSVRGRPPPPSPACLGEFLFYLRRVSGSNSTTLPRRASDMQFADIAYALKRETAAPCFLYGSFCFLSAVRPVCAGSSVPPYSAPAAGRFCPPYLLPQCCPAFPEPVACFAGRSYLYPGKDYRNAAPVIYSAVSYRFYNVFYKKGFTNEFQKHII